MAATRKHRPGARKKKAPKDTTASPQREEENTRTGGTMRRTGRDADEPRDRNVPPTVVVFGAGITGLTVAHELIERGFHVQVVERTASQQREYGVEVGGIAANQPAVVKADPRRLHPYLFADEQGYLSAAREGEIDDADARQLADDPALDEERQRQLRRWLLGFRAVPLTRSRRRVPLTESFQFEISCADRNPPEQEIETIASLLGAASNGEDHPGREDGGELIERFLERSDRHGATNRDKLQRAIGKLVAALVARAERLGGELGAASRFLKRDLRRDLGDGTSGDFHLAAVLRRETLLVEIRGHTNPDVDSPTARKLGLARARLVKHLLTGALQERLRRPESFERLRSALSQIDERKASDRRVTDFIDEIGRHLIAVSRAKSLPVGRRLSQRARSDRVDFRVIESPLPGEHGYRYFPSYYRHLFDTMRRTPMLDGTGNETAETALDQLITPPSVHISLEGKTQPVRIARRRFHSLADLRESAFGLLDELELEPRDLQVFLLRIFTFLTACTERRRGWENESWIDFLNGRTTLSEQFQTFHKDTAIALLAMDADEADAYTYALNAVQLLLDYRTDGSDIDMTLNGPTSERWLRPWKRYLVRQGVEFFHGELVGLRRDPGTGALQPLAVANDDNPGERHASESDAARTRRLLDDAGACPRPEHPSHRYAGYDPNRPDRPEPDFYVLALPFEQAGRLARAFDEESGDDRVLEGDWARLAAFDRHCIPRDRDGNDRVQWSDDDPLGGTERGELGKPRPAEYPLRDLSGVQFFFSNNVQIGHGHVIHASSEWGLTTIGQATHWRNRLSVREGYLGQLSVDIGNFYRRHAVEFDDPAKSRHYLGAPDADFKDELARPKSAWRCSWWEIPARVWDQIVESDETAVDPPRYYHMDEGILLRSHPDGSPDRVLPASNRTPFLINLPGQWRHRPGQVRRAGPGDADLDDGPEIWYRVSNRRWVLAGSYMATHTRLMTMEACNESARHAVNSILDAIHRCDPDDPDPPFHSAGKLLGRRCEIFDPNRHEIDDFEPLKQLDLALLREGLPHFVEILGVDRMVESMPRGSVSSLRLDEWRRACESSNAAWSSLYRSPVLDQEKIAREMRRGVEALSSLPGMDRLLAFLREVLP